MFWGVDRQPEDVQWKIFTRLTLQRANAFLYRNFVARGGGLPHILWRFNIHCDAQHIAHCYVRKNEVSMQMTVLELSEPIEEFISDTLFTKLLLICQPG